MSGKYFGPAKERILSSYYFNICPGAVQKSGLNFEFFRRGDIARAVTRVRGHPENLVSATCTVLNAPLVN